MKKIILISLLLLMMTACGHDPVDPVPQINTDSPALQSASDKDDTEEIPELTWQDQYDLGVSYLADGKYKDAVAAFDAAIGLDPKQPEVYMARGDAYISSGETEENLKMALNSYLTAFDLNTEKSDIYLKIADIYIALDEIDELQKILDQASEKFGETPDIAERRDDISPLKAGGISALLLSNAWDTSVQTVEYTFFFHNGQGLRLKPGEGWLSKGFSYTTEGDRVLIIENAEIGSAGNQYEEEWFLVDGEPQRFTFSFEEEEGIISEMSIIPVPVQDIFDTMAALVDNAVYGDAFWDDFLTLIVLYNQNALSKNAAASYQLEQEGWRAGVSQQILDKKFDLDSSAGKAWMKYYTKCRIYDLLGLPSENLNPPAEKPSEPASTPTSAEGPFTISEEQARQIASDYWGGAPFAEATDPDNPAEYETYIVYLGTVDHQGNTYYSFSLKWWINNGEYFVPRTVEPLYINAQTGDSMSMLP